MQPQSSQLLKRSREIVAAGFCQRAYAKNKDGNTVGPTDTDAVCFCMRGSVVKAAHEFDPTLQIANLTQRPITHLSMAVGGEIATWNDAHGRTLEEVLVKFDEAIEIALISER